MAEAKDAKRVVTLNDIKCNEDNKVMAAISVIPIVGLIMFFVEKDDLFVRYYAAQFWPFMFLFLVSWIPCIGWLIAVGSLIAMIFGFVKALQCERFDVPVMSGLALKMMNSM